MKSITVQPTAIQATSAAHAFLMYPPLEQVTRPTVPTNQAAYYLNRRPQTMRSWSSLQNGPIRAIRVHGRLAWRIEDIRAVLSGGRHGE